MSHVVALVDLFALVRRSIRRPAVPSSMGSRVKVALRVLAVLLSPVSAWAQEQPATPHSESQWGVGLGAGMISKPYTDVDDETIGLPILLYENRWVSIAGPGIDLKFPSKSSLSFRLRARYEPGVGYEADDSAALFGMEERKAGVWLGGAALWHIEIGDVWAEWLTDASGYSEGQRATVGLQRRFPLRRFSATPRIEAMWLDRKNVNYYYGVSAQEALASRPSYDAGSTINTRVGLRVDYRPAARHALFLDLSATRFGSEIEDSPIVDRSTSSAVFLGYVHMFRVDKPD